MKPKRERTCPHCKNKYRPFHTFQKHCLEHSSCIHEGNRLKREKANRAAVKKFKEDDKSHLMKVAQAEVNRYVRLRDKDEPCISCGVTNYRQEAGHYKSSGGHARIRFNTLNIFSQCHRCNCHLSANLVPYRANLIEKLGVEKVEWLESQKEPRKYTVEYLHRLIKVFRKKIRRIK